MALVKCKECQAEVSDKAKACPHCGAKRSTGMGCGGRVLLALFLVIVAVILIAQSDSSSPGGGAASTPPVARSTIPALTVVDWEPGTNANGSRVITGIVRNNSDKACRYVQVEFNLYDDADNQVGSTYTNVANLEAHGTWKFEAYIFEDACRSVKLKGVTGR